jgi:hypothetical protein
MMVTCPICHDGDCKNRMRSFCGYKLRAFGIVKIVKDNCLPIEALTLIEALPDIVPAAKRSALPTKPSGHRTWELR